MKTFLHIPCISNKFALACISNALAINLSFVLLKSCDFAPTCNIISISSKACNLHQILVNQNQKTGRNVKSILFK